MKERPPKEEKKQESTDLVPYVEEKKVAETSEHLIKPKATPKQKISSKKAVYKGLDMLPVKSSFAQAKPLPPRPAIEY